MPMGGGGAIAPRPPPLATLLVTRMLQPPHKFENLIVTTSTLAQDVGFAQTPFWSSFVKNCQYLGLAQ